MKTTACGNIVLNAINAVNETKGYEIEFRNQEQRKNWFRFTLKSRSGIPGARLSTSGKNIACASWHAYGYVIDGIFQLSPFCKINTLGKTYTKDNWKWEDKQMSLETNFSKLSIL